MKRVLTGILAVMLLSINVIATNVENNITTPVLTDKSKSNAAAVVYEYHPFDPDYSGIYINEFYCDSSRLTIIADDNKAYVVTDPTPFINGDLNCTLRYVANAQMIKSMKVASADQRRTDMPAYVLRLSDNAILDDIVASFSTTFTANKDTYIKVRDASNVNAKPIKMLVKNGAEIVLDHKMNVSYERLNRLQFIPKYNADFDSLTHNGPAGVESDIMYPDDDYENSTADYCWESLGQICAELEYSDDSSLSYVPKLSTFWMDGDALEKFSKNSAFIRDFGGANIKKRTQLLITNPFVTFDGEEIIPHEDITIYEYSGKNLKNVTNKFHYTKNSDGDGAFSILTDTLGVYILSDKKL